VEAFTGVVISAEVTLAQVILAGTTDGVAVATAGTAVVTAGVAVVTGGTVVVTTGVAADHMVVGIAAVGTAVPIGMAAAGTGTEVVRIGMNPPIGGGVILTVTALLTTTTSAVLRFCEGGSDLNRLHQRRGPLFQGRFKAVLHDPEESGLTINRYIHSNPVRIKRLGGHEARAGAEQRLGPAAEEVDRELVRARVEVLNSYRWSSYPAYAGKVKKPAWLNTESIRQSVAVWWKASGQPTGVKALESAEDRTLIATPSKTDR